MLPCVDHNQVKMAFASRPQNWGSCRSVFSFDISTSQEKMAVGILHSVIATWEAILLHNLETQRESRV